MNIGDKSNSKSTKAYDVKKNPKWLERGHSKIKMLDRDFERRLIRSQSCLVNFSLMAQVMKMDEPHNYADGSTPPIMENNSFGYIG